MEKEEFFLLRALINVIPLIIVLIASAYYLKKKSSVDGLLMTIGSFVEILSTIFHLVIVPNWQLNGELISSDKISIISIISLIGFFAILTFSIGLVMLVRKSVNKNASD